MDSELRGQKTDGHERPSRSLAGSKTMFGSPFMGKGMAESFQKEIPSSRINISVDLHTGGAQKKVELPLKLLIAGDFSAGKSKDPLSARKKVSINKQNFDQVLADYHPERRSPRRTRSPQTEANCPSRLASAR
jgi:hypothetical protein